MRNLIIGLAALACVGAPNAAYALAHDEVEQEDARERFYWLDDEAYSGRAFDAEAWAEVQRIADQLTTLELEGEKRFNLLHDAWLSDVRHDVFPQYWDLELAETGRDRSLTLAEAEAFMREEMAKLVASGLLERIGAVLEEPGLRPPPLEDVITLMDATSDIDVRAPRSIGRSLVVVGRHAVRTSDPALAVECFAHTLTIARMLLARPITINTLVGLSLEAAALDIARESITLERSTPALREALLVAFLEHQARRPDPGAYIEGEHLIMLDLIRAMYDHDMLTEDQKADEWSVWWNFPREKTTRRDWQRVYESLKAYDATPAHARDDLDETPEGIIDSFRGRSRLVETMTPALSRVSWNVSQGESLANAELLRLAIVVHRDHTGTLPQRLDDLVDAGVLPAIPDDQYAPDGRFRYRLDDNALRGFVLYGVGINGVDDSGVAHPEMGHRRSLGPWMNTGYDYMIEPQPEESQ